MLWSVIRLIFKTSSVTPEFFYVFNLILSFSTCSQSFKKICAWELLGANVLKKAKLSCGKADLRMSHVSHLKKKTSISYKRDNRVSSRTTLGRSSPLNVGKIFSYVTLYWFFTKCS